MGCVKLPVSSVEVLVHRFHDYVRGSIDVKLFKKCCVGHVRFWCAQQS